MGPANGEKSVVVLYKVVNNDADQNDPFFNAFSMPRGPKGPTLAAVKQNCAALYTLNHLGPEGYHWRVYVEDKPLPGAPDERACSWWDIQDENASLPIKDAPQSQLRKFFVVDSESNSSDVTTAARGALKSLGKAMGQAVTGAADGADSGPPISVIAFKLLDLVKMHDDFAAKHQGRMGGITPQYSTATPHDTSGSHHHHNNNHHSRRSSSEIRGAPPPTPAATGRSAAPEAPTPHRQAAPTQQQQQQAARTRTAPRPPPPQPKVSENLMDFGAPMPAASSAGRTLHHMHSAPMTGNESRAQKLQREYVSKKQTSNLVWDEVDQRYVEANSMSSLGGKSEHLHTTKKKEKGISLDPSTAVGKSAAVQYAVNTRVREMQTSQAKAVDEIRKREENRKRSDAEEDSARQKLEPRIKAWSEEHGKKKQLRALLGSLHTILWAEAKWKPVTIGDILDDAKVKKCYYKASLVVHPDKTHELDAEKRFLAKRIFDALSQAKKDFDNGMK